MKKLFSIILAATLLGVMPANSMLKTATPHRLALSTGEIPVDKVVAPKQIASQMPIPEKPMPKWQTKPEHRAEAKQLQEEQKIKNATKESRTRIKNGFLAAGCGLLTVGLGYLTWKAAQQMTPYFNVLRAWSDVRSMLAPVTDEAISKTSGVERDIRILLALAAGDNRLTDKEISERDEEVAGIVVEGVRKNGPYVALYGSGAITSAYFTYYFGKKAFQK